MIKFTDIKPNAKIYIFEREFGDKNLPKIYAGNYDEIKADTEDGIDVVKLSNKGINHSYDYTLTSENDMVFESKEEAFYEILGRRYKNYSKIEIITLLNQLLEEDFTIVFDKNEKASNRFITSFKIEFDNYTIYDCCGTEYSLGGMGKTYFFKEEGDE